jgi:hypothetical protein
MSDEDYMHTLAEGLIMGGCEVMQSLRHNEPAMALAFAEAAMGDSAELVEILQRMFANPPREHKR